MIAAMARARALRSPYGARGDGVESDAEKCLAVTLRASTKLDTKRESVVAFQAREDSRTSAWRQSPPVATRRSPRRGLQESSLPALQASVLQDAT